MGITYTTWKRYHDASQDARFFNMSDEDWFEIFNNLYFKAVRGSEFKSLNVAALVVGMAWGSGKKQAGITLQTALRNLGTNGPNPMDRCYDQKKGPLAGPFLFFFLLIY